MEMTLSKAPFKKLKIIKISGGHNIIKKLSALGMYEGIGVEKLVSYDKGPIVIRVLNCQVAIGRGIAEKIIVKVQE